MRIDPSDMVAALEFSALIGLCAFVFYVTPAGGWQFTLGLLGSLTVIAKKLHGGGDE